MAAGVIEDGDWRQSEVGSPQGASLTIAAVYARVSSARQKKEEPLGPVGRLGHAAEPRLHRPPLLANVYLHYVLDLWAEWWRSRFAHGDVIIVRWADDFIVGFEHRGDAQRFLIELRQRLAKFGLELHPGKTRLIEFGRYAAQRRRRRGLGKPETFTFLGFTHICATSKNGR